MIRFNDYSEAYRYAVAQAQATKLDTGIRRTKELGTDGFNVSFLPKPENTYGSELMSERVTPGSPLTN
jgi:hypothetical protein